MKITKRLKSGMNEKNAKNARIASNAKIAKRKTFE